MKALIESQSQSKIESRSDLANVVEEKLVNSKIEFDYKFYQNFFVILLSLCTFLIFPESPQDSDVLCKKYQAKEVCNVW
tara:strand:- start:151 stop:387 length:237 start_codon:yes stop_codon:yes gene_type:complete